MCDVLIVDDDFMVARAHQRIVAQQVGFTVVGVAVSGADALAQIVDKAPHLVLLDMYLPDMTGLDVIRRAREAGWAVDFLVLSAAREAEMVTAALQGGIVSYLLKPFKIIELQSRLVGYGQRRRLLDREGDLNQIELDRVIGPAPVVPPTGALSTLPKGLSKETAAPTTAALTNSKPDLAASECAELLGLSRVVARKYLEYLVATGQAAVSLRYGQTGRPQRRYAWLVG
ncbi:response regulator [Cryobacterium sp. Y57]|uniref:response regulator n=1 Tax=Cryobacterium sp. Y57 TaxID=2048287 RepID=UPI000CE4207D|nr:response regulator [Cryobacterium sp. Y57]